MASCRSIRISFQNKTNVDRRNLGQMQTIGDIAVHPVQLQGLSRCGFQELQGGNSAFWIDLVDVRVDHAMFYKRIGADPFIEG